MGQIKEEAKIEKSKKTTTEKRVITKMLCCEKKRIAMYDRVCGSNRGKRGGRGWLIKPVCAG